MLTWTINNLIERNLPMAKRIFLAIISLCVIISIAACSSGPSIESKKAQPIDRVAHPDQLKYPILEVKIPKPERLVLSNGIVVYMIEDKELPLITVKVLLRSGAIYDAPDKTGTASLVARLLRTGGTTNYPADQLDEKLEFMAADLGATAGDEEMLVTFNFLSRDFKQSMNILHDVIFAPAFPEDKLEKEKSRILERIRRENDDPDSVAFREFRKLTYPNHPYGRQSSGTALTVQNITSADLKQFHHDYFITSNMMIGISGYFDKTETLSLLKELFEKETPREKKTNDIKPIERKYEKSINLVNKEISQSAILFGHLGIERLNPDYFTFMVMNEILGGSAVSRLYDEIREKRGLAYSVYSFFTRPRDIGLFVVGTSTKNESVVETTNLFIEEINKIKDNLVEETELANTKEALINGFVFRFENSVGVLEQFMFREHIGLPDNYLESYRDNVMKVTREDIKRVAQEYLQTEKFVLVIVGDSMKFDKPLSEFGTVNEIKLGNSGK